MSDLNRYIGTSNAGVSIALAGLGGTPVELNLGVQFGRVCSDFTYDKAVDKVYDHLLEMLRATLIALDVSPEFGLDLIETRRRRAHAKHGENSIEAKNGGDTLFWLSCLGEEFGEWCAEVVGSEEWSMELLDMATVTVAWLAALGRDGL